jgi:steroid delta-isomerase-like uncharacterized protein
MRWDVLVLLSVLAAACGCSGASDANKSRNIGVVERQHSEIWSRGNLDLIPAVYAETVVGHFPAGPVHGRDEIRARVEAHRRAFPDWTETVDDVIADGSRVVTRVTSRGTNLGEFLGNPPTGNHVEISEASIFRLADGMIEEMWVYPDFRSMQQQLDATPQ